MAVKPCSPVCGWGVQLPGQAKAALTGNTAAMQQLQGKAASFSLLLHLIASPAFRPGVISEDLVRCFATCIQLTFVPNSAHLSHFKVGIQQYKILLLLTACC